MRPVSLELLVELLSELLAYLIEIHILHVEHIFQHAIRLLAYAFNALFQYDQYQIVIRMLVSAHLVNPVLNPVRFNRNRHAPPSHL